jgi:hypothetical protein
LKVETCTLFLTVGAVETKKYNGNHESWPWWIMSTKLFTPNQRTQVTWRCSCTKWHFMFSLNFTQLTAPVEWTPLLLTANCLIQSWHTLNLTFWRISSVKAACNWKRNKYDELVLIYTWYTNKHTCWGATCALNSHQRI